MKKSVSLLAIVIVVGMVLSLDTFEGVVTSSLSFLEQIPRTFWVLPMTAALIVIVAMGAKGARTDHDE